MIAGRLAGQSGGPGQNTHCNPPFIDKQQLPGSSVSPGWITEPHLVESFAPSLNVTPIVGDQLTFCWLKPKFRSIFSIFLRVRGSFARVVVKEDEKHKFY